MPGTQKVELAKDTLAREDAQVAERAKKQARCCALVAKGDVSDDVAARIFVSRVSALPLHEEDPTGNKDRHARLVEEAEAAVEASRAFSAVLAMAAKPPKPPK